MDKARFDAILAAYGADPRRWPADERAQAEAFAAHAGAAVGEARALDAALDLAPGPAPASDLLAARILAARKRAPRINPMWAMAACMAGGVLLGVGAGLNAPADAEPDVDWMIVAAFDSPLDWDGGAP
jgi:hypothetical protein